MTYNFGTQLYNIMHRLINFNASAVYHTVLCHTYFRCVWCLQHSSNNYYYIQLSLAMF